MKDRGALVLGLGFRIGATLPRVFALRRPIDVLDCEVAREVQRGAHGVERMRGRKAHAGTFLALVEVLGAVPGVVARRLAADDLGDRVLARAGIEHAQASETTIADLGAVAELALAHEA